MKYFDQKMILTNLDIKNHDDKNNAENYSLNDIFMETCFMKLLLLY